MFGKVPLCGKTLAEAAEQPTIDVLHPHAFHAP
jgi:hypothetical protein